MADETLGCEEALRRLAAYLDDELEEPQRAEVARHLERCRGCFSRAEFERRLKGRIRQDLGVTHVPEVFEQRIRSLLRSLPPQG